MLFKTIFFGSVYSFIIIKYADSTEFPFYASLRYDGKHFCGGALISEDYIITAAHCFEGKSEKIQVVLGTTSLSEKGDVYNVLWFKNHPQFDYNYCQNDLSIIKLETKVKLQKNQVEIISLTNNQDIAANSIVIIPGHCSDEEYNDPNRQPSNNLRKIQYAVENRDFCTQQFGIHKLEYLITKRSICLSMNFEDKLNGGSCRGLSGSPVVYNNVIVGVLSRCGKISDKLKVRLTPDIAVNLGFYKIDKCIMSNDVLFPFLSISHKNCHLYV